MHQEQDRAERDVDADRHIDAPFEIPTIDLQEIEIPAVGRLNRPSKAEQLEHIADGAEAGERDVDGDEAGSNHAEDEQLIDQHRQQRAYQQHEAGDQPYRPLDVPAGRGDDVNTFAQSHGCYLLRSADSMYEASREFTLIYIRTASRQPVVDCESFGS